MHSTHLDSNLDSTESFPSQSITNPERFAEICEIVKTQGLYGFFTQLDSLGIGRDVFLNNEDFLYLASLDKSQPVIPYEANRNAVEQVRNVILKKHPEVLEKNGEGMLYIENEPFQSWEETITKKPKITFVPKTKVGLQNVIKWAKAQNIRIRASGYRHSSSDVYPDDNEILVSMVDINTAINLPAKYPTMDPNSDIQGIELVGEPYEVDGKKKIKCKIGAATCNYHFIDWVHDPKRGNFQWTLPLNVIMSEISFGGSNAMICHGAGIHNKTLSDLVKEIEFINVNGEIQTVTDPELIKAAAGCFGMLGIVTSITFELDEMTYANFKSVEKKLLVATIPPGKNSLTSDIIHNINHENIKLLSNRKELEKAFQSFVDKCENSYYSEWFWFPLQDKCWINCWQNNGKKQDSVRYPNDFDSMVQRTGSYLAYLAANATGDTSPIMRKIQTKLMGDLAMMMLPDKKNITCTLLDALHFRKGIQNFKTRMMEVEIPIPNLSNSDKPDWSIAQKAWWDVIGSIYTPENLEYFPMRTTLEMRVMGGSDVTMAAQYKNLRTCSIEILTPVAVDEARWEKFLQEIIDKWANLKDDQGRYLSIKPHWGKRFDKLIINRDISWIDEWDNHQKISLQNFVNFKTGRVAIPVREYLRTMAYKDQATLFMQQIDTICRQGGYSYNDTQALFSNRFLDYIFSNSRKISMDFRVKNMCASSLFRPKSMLPNKTVLEDQPKITYPRS